MTERRWTWQRVRSDGNKKLYIIERVAESSTKLRRREAGRRGATGRASQGRGGQGPGAEGGKGVEGRGRREERVQAVARSKPSARRLGGELRVVWAVGGGRRAANHVAAPRNPNRKHVNTRRRRGDYFGTGRGAHPAYLAAHVSPARGTWLVQPLRDLLLGMHNLDGLATRTASRPAPSACMHANARTRLAPSLARRLLDSPPRKTRHGSPSVRSSPPLIASKPPTWSAP